MDTWPILEEELIRYRDVSVSIKRFLDKYENECQILIQQMKDIPFDDAQTIFEKLYNIQGKLATALYKYGYPLNETLSDFVYHFDRDDIPSRKYWHQKFNDGLMWPSE